MSDKKDILLKKALLRIVTMQEGLSMGYFRAYADDNQKYVVVARKWKAKERWSIDLMQEYGVFSCTANDKLHGNVEEFDSEIRAIDRFMQLVFN